MVSPNLVWAPSPWNSSSHFQLYSIVSNLPCNFGQLFQGGTNLPTQISPPLASWLGATIYTDITSKHQPWRLYYLGGNWIFVHKKWKLNSTSLTHSKSSPGRIKHHYRRASFVWRLHLIFINKWNPNKKVCYLNRKLWICMKKCRKAEYVQRHVRFVNVQVPCASAEQKWNLSFILLKKTL